MEKDKNLMDLCYCENEFSLFGNFPNKIIEN